MSLKLKFIGHSTFWVETAEGLKVLIDPFFTGNEQACVTLDQLDNPDIILVTHGAKDHMGDALALMKRSDATLMCARDVRAYAKRNGIPPERMKVMVMGFVREERDLRVQALETHHGSFIEDTDGSCFSDVCLAYLLRSGVASLYHMADTAIFSDLKLFGELYKPRVLLVPIGSAPGALTELTPEEAALAVSWMRPETAIPIHYQFDAEAHHLEIFRRELSRLAPEVKLLPMAPGETILIA